MMFSFSGNPEACEHTAPQVEFWSFFGWLKQRTRIAVLIGALGGAFSAQPAVAQPSMPSASAPHVLGLPDPPIKEKERKDTPSLLPEYPVSSKLAVIVNGDSKEERHIRNVERAMDVLRGKGFEDFFVVSDQKLNGVSRGIRQFHGTQEGMEELFSALGKDGLLKKDSLVFFYVTGHGGSDSGGACISLRDGCYPQKKAVESLKSLKDAGARGVFVLDGCYSGTFPSAIMESGIEGVALSPGVAGKETACQFFSKPFFESLAKGYDSNKDGFSEPSEWFQAAMAAYRISADPVNRGSYVESRPELSLSNIDEILKTKKMLLIDVNATWCGPCKIYRKTLDQLAPMVGGLVKIVKLTVDTHDDKEIESLFKKLGVERPQGFPTTLLRVKDGQFASQAGAIPLPDLLALLKSNGVEANNDPLISNGVEANDDPLIEVLQKETKKSKKIVRRYLDLGIRDPMVISLGDDPKAVFLNLAKTNPSLALKHIDHFKGDKLFYLRLLEKAAKSAAEREPGLALLYVDAYKDQPWAEEVVKKAAKIDPCLVLDYADRYKDQPWAKGVILGLADKHPGWTLESADRYKDQPYYAEVLEKAARNAAEKHPSVAFHLVDRYKDQPYYAEVLEKAARNAAEREPGLALAFADQYKDQPWAKEVFEKARMSNRLTKIKK